MVSFSRRPKHRDAIFDKDDDKIFHRVATNVEPPRDRRHPKAPTETERTGPRGKDAGISICTILFRASFARTQWQKSGKVDRSNRSGFFRRLKKRLRFVTLNLTQCFFFSFYYILTKYLHYISTKTASTTGPRFSRRAQRKRSRSSLYSNDEIFIDSSLQRLDDVGFERVSTVAGFFHR